MAEEIFTVPNISCDHCVMTIKNEVGELEGVELVEGDPEDKTIKVSFDAPATTETIRKKLDEINYPAK